MFFIWKYSDKQSIRGSAIEFETLSAFAATRYFGILGRSIYLGLPIMENKCFSALVFLELGSPPSLSFN